MKKKAILFALCAALASCNNGQGDASIRTKVIDSMMNEFTSGHISRHKFATPLGDQKMIAGLQKVYMNSKQLPDTSTIMPSLIPVPLAQYQINAWIDTVKATPNLVQDTSCISFILPINNIMYMKDDQFCDYVVFYLSLNKDQISLVYIGAQQFAGQDSLIIYPVMVNGIQNAFDNTIPCPECPMAGLVGKSGNTLTGKH